MSFSNRIRSAGTAATLGLALSATVFLQGCQVRPLYATTTGATQNTAAVAVDPVGDRVSQQVRNALVYNFSQGAGDPSDPRYRLAIHVAEQRIGLFVTSATDSPTSGDMKITVSYVLTDAMKKDVIKKGQRSALASYDLPAQEFTKIRSGRDAEDRASKMVADLVTADVAAALAH